MLRLVLAESEALSEALRLCAQLVLAESEALIGSTEARAQARACWNLRGTN